MLTRRQFLAATAALAATPALRAIAADDVFSFPLLGDIHYDRLDDHDLAWLKQAHPGDVRQVENYSRITADVLAPLLAEVSSAVRSAKAPVPFVAQIGDLVEGLCGSPALARKQADEALAAVAEAHFDRPFLMTKRNHDVTGPGAKDVFQEVLLGSFINHPTCSRQHRASFAVEHPTALLAFFDCYDAVESLAWLQSLVTNELRGRQLIVLTHQPVVPYTPRLWHVFERPADATKRAALLDLLGQHRAIVLNGHLHKYGLLVRETGHGGRFAQLSISSVIASRDAKPKQVVEGKEHYGPGLLELEPDFSPTTAEARAAYLKAEAPRVSHYNYADAAGYAMLHVRGATVTADVYNAVGQDRWRSVGLTDLLA